MSHTSKFGKIFFSLIFTSILIIGGLLFFILPKETISENEKRRLTPLPKFSTSSLQSGTLMDSLDLYFSDNFIFRNTLISTANKIKENFGKKDEESRIYTKQSKPISKSILSLNKPKDPENSKTKESRLEYEENSDTPYENIKSVIVYKNRAIQIFGGLNSVLKNYAGMVSKYKKELGPGVNVYCMAVPVGSDFFLPGSFNHSREKNSINFLYSQLDPAVKGVRAYEELEKHQQEYIQFNTDHHWTGRAAYYAYTAFCKSAGFNYLPMNKLNRKVIHNFVGTLYYYTLSESLKKNKDSVEYFKIPNKTNSFYFSEGITKARPTTLYAERARGGNSYGVFLGADFPLMRITSDVKNARKILQIKDSYGNAFAPFLPSLYEEVFVVDYRYFNGSIKELVKKYGITDVVFTHNIFVINSSFTAKRENNMLNGVHSSVTSKQKVKPDSSKNKSSK